VITLKSASKDWIEGISRTTTAKDKILVEKVVRALMLLEGLCKSGLNFVFKGGTALMLLLGSGKRLSIDIDIIIPDKNIKPDEALNNICKEYGFNRFQG